MALSPPSAPVSSAVSTPKTTKPGSAPAPATGLGYITNTLAAPVSPAEAALRPLSFSDFTGQPKTVERLQVMVGAAKRRGDPLNHILLSGPPGGAGTSLWSTGFLPSVYQGVQFRSSGDPVLFLSNPEGHSRSDRRQVLDAVKALNQQNLGIVGDPEIATRIASYEMAWRMQSSAPELTDLRNETDATLALYGCTRDTPSFARNCLLARRLVERGVRFVQLYHTNWDSHGGPGETLENDLEKVAHQVDQGCAALVKDLKSRGMLDDVLVVWGGEFGRTPMGETREKTGRNHHIDAFTMWFAGAGIRAGQVLGETDELGFNPVSDRAHVHDIHATLLHLLGLDHQRLTYRFQGRDYRLTDIHGELLHKLMA